MRRDERDTQPKEPAERPAGGVDTMTEQQWESLLVDLGGEG